MLDHRGGAANKWPVPSTRAAGPGGLIPSHTSASKFRIQLSLRRTGAARLLVPSLDVHAHHDEP
jgi:hypothetical protein